MKKIIILVFIIFSLTSCFTSKTIDNNISINNEEIENDTGSILNEESQKYYNILNGDEYKKAYEKVNNLEINKNIDFGEFNFINVQNVLNEKKENNDLGEIQIKELKIVLYNNDFLINAIKENDPSKCDENELRDDFGNISFSKYCRGIFYLNKVLVENNSSYCDNFKDNLDYGYLLGSNLGNSVVCKKFFDLNNILGITDEDIKNFIIDIQGSFNDDTFNIIKTYILKEDYCNKIPAIKTKIMCYIGLYQGDFYNNFENLIYPDLIKSEFLYDEKESKE